MTSKRRFGNFFLRPRDQLVFAVQMLAVPLCVAVVLLTLGGVPHLIQVMEPGSSSVGVEVHGAVMTFGAQQALWFVACLSYCLFSAVVVSHRVFGPVHAMERRLRAALERRPGLEPLRTREGDYFKELTELVERVASQALPPDETPPKG